MQLNLITNKTSFKNVSFLNCTNTKNGIHIACEEVLGDSTALAYFTTSKGIPNHTGTIHLKHDYRMLWDDQAQKKLENMLEGVLNTNHIKETDSDTISIIKGEDGDLKVFVYLENIIKEILSLDKEEIIEQEEEVTSVCFIGQPSTNKGYKAKKAFARNKLDLKAYFYYKGMFVKYTYVDFAQFGDIVRFMLVAETTNILEGVIYNVQTLLDNRSFKKLFLDSCFPSNIPKANNGVEIEVSLEVTGKRLCREEIPVMYRPKVK